MTDIDSQQRIRARFVTKHDNYRVTDVAISVPLKLHRSGLTEVIHHLLGHKHFIIHTPSIRLQVTQIHVVDVDAINNENKLKQFDFLINDQLLQVSLHSFIRENGISTEDVIEIEYFPLAFISDKQVTRDMQAWVGCIDASVKGFIFTGCYDGTLKVVDSKKNMKILNSITAHQYPIRSIHATDAYLLTGSKDHTVKFFSVNASDMSEVGNLVGHTSSVESVHSIDRVALSGDWQGNILGWDIKQCSQQAIRGVSDEPIRKKKKGTIGLSSQAQVSTINHAFVIRAHSQCVSGIHMVEDTERFYTCSHDHTVKIWDLERQDCISTFVSSKIATSLNWSSLNSLIASSHPDGKVRIWDPRKTEESVNIGAYGNNQQWISQVKWAPASEYIFSSIDYDGNMTLWDIRATMPLSVIEAHPDSKGLTLDWILSSDSESNNNFSRIATGGSDCLLQVSEVSL